MMQVTRNIKTFHDYEVINFHCTILLNKDCSSEREILHTSQPARGPESQYQVIENSNGKICLHNEGTIPVSVRSDCPVFLDKGKVVITT